MAKLDATFFALQRRDRAVLVPATLILVLILAVIAAAFAALNWRAISFLVELFQTLPTQPKGHPPAPEMVAPLFGMVGSVFLFLFPVYLAVAAYEAACLRWMIRGEAPGFFGFALDHDTWRVYGVYWCWLIAQFAVSTAASIITMPFLFAGMGEVLRNPEDTAAMMRWQLGVQLPISLLQYLPLIFIGVRFGPGAATSIARRRFSFLDAWKVTRGRFWELFGSFALLWAGLIVVYLVSFGFALSPQLQQLWPYITTGASPPQAEVLEVMTAIFSPAGLMRLALAYALNLLVWITYAILSYGINARAAMAALEEGKIEVAPPTA